MKSSEGLYFPRLDHVRAIAAFLVFFWHFVHAWIPTSHVPAFFPVSILEEGHTGVALFMTLSGYLFAKITFGKTLDYKSFLYNRFVRLAPLLFCLFAYYAIFHRFTIGQFFHGFIVPTKWPGGGWTLTVEMHFYLAFPFMLLLQARYGTRALVACLLLSLSLRTGLWLWRGQVQVLSYFTIVGKIDQFLLGIIFYQVSKSALYLRHATALFVASVLGFMLVWHGFNLLGGFYHIPVSPSPSPLWIIIPTIEGLFFGSFIASYDNLDVNVPEWINRPLAYVGEVSYSIYLLHFLIITDFLRPNLPAPADFAEASLMAVAAFPLFVLLASLTYRLIEVPFFRFRTKYLTRPTA